MKDFTISHVTKTETFFLLIGVNSKIHHSARFMDDGTYLEKLDRFWYNMISHTILTSTSSEFASKSRIF